MFSYLCRPMSEHAYRSGWMVVTRPVPKTGLVLTHMHLTPNHVLRSVINEWCALHGIEVQKKRPKTVNCSPEDIANIDDLIKKLSSDDISVQREAAGELRLLAKRNVEHRICVAEQGAIPLLIKLLTSSDRKTQEHAVTALLNLSINHHNKGQIVIAGTDLLPWRYPL